MKIWPGRPYPLGATWDGRGVNFALFSAHATRVELCLFDRGTMAEVRLHSAARTDGSGLALLPARRAAGPAVRLSRARSVSIRNTGHRFNPNKIVTDPYAKLIGRDIRWSDAMFGYRIGARAGRTCRSTGATTWTMRALAVVVDPRFRWGRDRPPAHAVAQDGDLRGACARLDDAAPGGPAASARHVRRAWRRAA